MKKVIEIAIFGKNPKILKTTFFSKSSDSGAVQVDGAAPGLLIFQTAAPSSWTAPLMVIIVRFSNFRFLKKMEINKEFP